MPTSKTRVRNRRSRGAQAARERAHAKRAIRDAKGRPEMPHPPGLGPRGQFRPRYGFAQGQRSMYPSRRALSRQVAGIEPIPVASSVAVIDDSDE